MITNKEYKRLTEIDDKMLSNKPITEKERTERLKILNKVKSTEIDEGEEAYKEHLNIY